MSQRREQLREWRCDRRERGQCPGQLICGQGSAQRPPLAKSSLNSPVWLTSRCGVEA